MAPKATARAAAKATATAQAAAKAKAKAHASFAKQVASVANAKAKTSVAQAKAAVAKPKASVAKTKAKAKGRPPKSILKETSELCLSFESSDQESKLWWGSECKTQLMKIKDLRKEFERRIESATEPETIESLEPSHKKIRVLALLLEAHQKSGFDSEGFVECYDCCLTLLRRCQPFH